MEDLKALTECAECTWDYIDRLRMALAAACKERDEARKELHEAKSELAKYREAEQDGRLVLLPCKVGAPIYTTHWWKDVKEKCTDSKGNSFYRTVHKNIIKKERFNPFGTHYEWLGKSVFLTREEADAALKGGEG